MLRAEEVRKFQDQIKSEEDKIKLIDDNNTMEEWWESCSKLIEKQITIKMYDNWKHCYFDNDDNFTLGHKEVFARHMFDRLKNQEARDYIENKLNSLGYTVEFRINEYLAETYYRGIDSKMRSDYGYNADPNGEKIVKVSMFVKWD